MPRFATAIVTEVLQRAGRAARLAIEIDGHQRRAWALLDHVGEVSVGDTVAVNTTAVDLGLGSGGEDFVVWNLAHDAAGVMSGGHILKMRYTPSQTDVLAAEAPESPSHDKLREAEAINGLPVVACGLHSQIAPVLCSIRHRHPGAKIAYLMTDGASLPLQMSRLVWILIERGLIDVTITCGHAFGGGLESVNVYSGLAAAKWVAEADVVVSSIGPGVVGTGTRLGHTGMQQGETLTATAALGGRAIAAIRISFADPRARHRGVSHHFLTAMRLAARERSVIPIPSLSEGRLAEVMEQLEEGGIRDSHDLKPVETTATVSTLGKFGIQAESMGRSPAEDPEFFDAAAAAGLYAAGLLEGGR